MPTLQARVTDLSATLNTQELQTLEAHLAGIEQRLGSQIVVLIVSSTQGEEIAAFAYRVASAWRVGRRDVGDGIVIVVARQDRQVRIEVARALEGAVPDLAASRIIERTLVPAFRAGDYAGGLTQASDQLASLLAGEGLPPALQGDPKAQAEGWLEHLPMVLFMGVPMLGAVLRSLMGRKGAALVAGSVVGVGAAWVTGSLLIGLIAGVVGAVIGAAQGAAVGGSRWPPGMGGRGGGGWSSGGGFSSGGGGSFGGGGASGRW